MQALDPAFDVNWLLNVEEEKYFEEIKDQNPDYLNRIEISNIVFY